MLLELRLQPSTQKSPVDRRAAELDTIAAVQPMERRDDLAGLLTDEAPETLNHLVNEAMGANTLHALTPDNAIYRLGPLPPPESR